MHTARSARKPSGTPIPIPIFAPSLRPESLADGLSGSEVDDAVSADIVVEEAAVDMVLPALDAGVDVGHAVEGPYWTIK